jgi:predicted small secreted protein
MRKLIVLAAITAALAATAVTTTACNTVKGAGEDVSAAGDAVSDTAEKAKPN